MQKSKARALEDIEITPEMMEAGANFLIESGYLSADHVAITESLKAMMKDLLLAALSGKSRHYVANAPAVGDGR